MLLVSDEMCMITILCDSDVRKLVMIFPFVILKEDEMPKERKSRWLETRSKVLDKNPQKWLLRGQPGAASGQDSRVILD